VFIVESTNFSILKFMDHSHMFIYPFILFLSFFTLLIVSKYKYFVKKIAILFFIVPIILFSNEQSPNPGGLFILPISTNWEEGQIQRALNFLKDREIGGVIFMGGTASAQRNLAQVLKNEEDLQDLLIFQDAEWGVAMRLKEIAPLPKNLTLGALQDPKLLEAFGLELARQCRSVGVRGDFAPVVDVNSNPHNPVIGARSLGDNPEVVANQALAILRGMQRGGVWATAKHFPGHGDTAIDSHLALPKIDKSLEELLRAELVPFQKLIDGGVDLVMVGHLLVPALSEQPSSLSYEVMTELLREQMGFEGVIVTDALNMQALEGIPFSERVSKALLGGADLVLIATAKGEEAEHLFDQELSDALAHLETTFPKELIQEKRARIQALKEKPLPPIPAEDRTLRSRLYRAALTRLGTLPQITAPLALIQPQPDPLLESALAAYAPIHCFSYEAIDQIPPHFQRIVSVCPKKSPPHVPEAVYLLFDTPYRLAQLPKAAPTLVGYEDVLEVKQAFADALFGKFIPLGKLPVQVSRDQGVSDERECRD
jgi:beta-glucosidase-like glycosyl hydrolase